MSQVSNKVPNSTSDSDSFFSDLLKVCQSSQVICCGVDTDNQDRGTYTLLFNSSMAAKEAADVLRGDWDGSNAATVRQYDVVTIREDDSIVVEYAGESVKLDSREEVEFCQQGQYCFLNQLSMHSKTQARSSKSIILGEKTMSALEGELERVSVEFPNQSPELE